MKQIFLRIILLTTLLTMVVLINTPFADKNQEKIFTLPGLPKPIAKQPIVITSAGQSTDTYILRDISNQLMLRSYFMPQAKDTDLKDVSTLVFVVGYSSLGVKLQNITFEEEKLRIKKLLSKAEEDGLAIITVLVGGEKTQDKKTEELIELIGSKADYLIGSKDCYHVNTLTELAKEKDIPLTLVNEAGALSGPFASAFR
jgi:hypothetical protein